MYDWLSASELSAFREFISAFLLSDLSLALVLGWLAGLVALIGDL